RYMAPLMVEKPCLRCHASQGYKVGDVRGGISISQWYAPIVAAMAPSIVQTQRSYLAMFLLTSAIGWLLLELLRRRWMDLADKIDELEATRGELVLSEKMASLGRMVAGFAHEINTPVGVAVGAVSHNADTLNHINQLLSQEDVSEEALRAALDGLRQSSTLAMSNLRRAANLVQSFKRTSVDQSSEQTRPFEMRELFDDVLFALHSTLKKLPIQISVHCPDTLRINGAPGLIEQLLTNLLMNAIQHAFDDAERAGKISIEASRQGDEVHLVFTDNGKGMAAATLGRIFEPFFTTRRGQGGSGLGLYICYNIVTTRLGGSIRCDSQPDAGCRFDIRFPAIFINATAEANA
ncbi:MAG: ATP-binding protein, partial [Rhodoferax sp.]